MLGWDRAGRSILIHLGPLGEASRWDVMRGPADGRGPASLVFSTPRAIGNLSPDGSRFAYSTNEGAGQLWALDRVLSMLK